MKQQEWLNWLEQSLQDNRLDDDEKYQLRDKLEQAKLSSDDQAFVRNQSFKLAQQAMDAGSSPKQILNWLERVIKVLDNSRGDKVADVADCWFSPGTECMNGIIHQIKRCKKALDICVFTITDVKLSKEIIAAQKRGVKVRLITDNHKVDDRGSDINDLALANIHVKIDDTEYHMHHKFAIFDSKHLINGSFNWTYTASKHNQEDITLTSDLRFVSRFTQHFDKLWAKFPDYNAY